MKTVAQMFNVKQVEGDFGLEVELEGRLGNRNTVDRFRYEHDGSLEDGVELVLREPTPIGDLKLVMSDLSKVISSCTIKPSIRCGVHIHINATHMNALQLVNFLTIYYTLENIMLDHCGEGRQSNLFCLRGADAEYQIKCAGRALSGDVHSLDDTIRYTALNLLALRNYGSLEFRALRTPTKSKMKEISKWVEVLLHIRECAMAEESPAKILSTFSGFEAKEFVLKYLPQLAQDVFNTDGWVEKLKSGMRIAQDLVISGDWDELGKEDEIVRNLPDMLKQLIADHPHIDPREVERLWRARNGNNI